MNELAFTKAELKFNLILNGFVSRSFKKKMSFTAVYFGISTHLGRVYNGFTREQGGNTD